MTTAPGTIPPVYERHATVTRVIDGDTLYLAVDLGCDTTLAMTVRLIGLNAPEMNTDAGKAAKAFVEGWVDTYHRSSLLIGTRLALRTIKDRREKYGRYLADLVPVDADGQLDAPSLCQALLDAGHATPYQP